jgi:pectate disaccharide-lyase
MTTFAQDSFAGRTVGSGLGSASDGINVWAAPNLSSHAIVSVGSNEGNIYYDNAGTGGGTYASNLGSGAVRDVDISIRFSFLSLTGVTEIDLVARYQDANNWYRGTYVGSHLYFIKNVAGVRTTTSVATVSTLTAGTYYRLRFKATGSALSLTLWQDGSSEPAPQWSGTDTSLTLPGSYGFVAIATGITAATGINIDSFLAQSVSAQLTDLYVDATAGNDTNSGTSGSPLATIQQGMNMVAPGGTVHIISGTYPQALTMRASAPSSALRIAINANVRKGALINPSGAQYCVNVLGSYIDIWGLDVLGDANTNMGVRFIGPGCTCKQCRVRNIASPNATYASGGGGIVGQTNTATGLVVDACEVYNTGTTADLIPTIVQPIYVQGANSIVSNNIIVGSYASGITIGHYATGSQAVNNAICNTSFGLQVAGIDVTIDNVVVANNIFYWYGYVWQQHLYLPGTYTIIRETFSTGTNNQYLNNIYYGPSAGAVFTLQNGLVAQGSIHADPRFANYKDDGTGDYRITPISPGRSAGASGAFVPAADFAGTTRSAPYDIGSYEYLPSQWAPLYGAVGSQTVTILQAMAGYDERVDDTASCRIALDQGSGQGLTQESQLVLGEASSGALLYAGFVDGIEDGLLPGTNKLISTVTGKDMSYLARKRYWTGREFNNWTAGDIACEVHRLLLAPEGVIAAYAMRHDYATSDFAAGTLTGVVASNNTLTLAPSGSDFTQVEDFTADFATGTLTNVTAAFNALFLTSYKAIKYSGSAGANLDNNNLYAKRKIWAGSAYTLVLGDKISYDVWIDSRSPEIKIGLELQFSDGTWMHDDPTNYQDQEAIELDPATDLKGWADDQWYSRTCVVGSPAAGHVVVAAYLDIEGEKGGDYIGYFKNIRITNSSDVVQRTIFATFMSANVRASSNGYFNLNASMVTVYEDSGTRVSPARSISSVGIVKGSVISWVEKDAAQPSGGASTQYPPQVLVEASYDDGVTYLPCTNHAPLPGLIVGMNTSGRSIMLRQTLAVGGPSPEIAPYLGNCSFTVYSAAAATKSDFVDIRGTQALLSSGVLANATSYTDGIKTTGQYRNWDNLDFSSQTLFGLSGAGNPSQGCQTGYFFLRTDNGLDCRSQFNFAGQWQNFIAEIDVHLVAASGQYGLVYRTTSWVNANNSFGYVAWIDSGHVALSKGNNGAGGTFVTILSTPITLTVGAWYRMKVAVNGNNHQIYVNDVLFVNVVGDSSYPNAGYFGARLWNGTSSRDSGHYDNFGVVGYEADLISVSSWTTPALALSGIVGDSRLNWNASILSSSDLVVESTLNNGTLWEACTNGGQIPQLINGYNAAGKSLKIRYTMTNQSVNLPIALLGHSVFVIGAYSASGTRVSPALDISGAGTIGSSSVSWQALTPAGTAAPFDTSPDNSTWTSGVTNGAAIAGLVAQGAMVSDDFDTNTAANFTATNWAGGAAPVFTIDTANSRMQVTSGTNGILLWNVAQFPAAADVSLELITDQCDTAGFVLRYTSVDNCYYVTYRDDSASSNPGTVAIRKRVTATDTQIVAPAALPAAFTRGTYHTLKVSIVGSVITALYDGVQAAQVTDTSLTAAGQVGIRQHSAVTSDWYSLRAIALGAPAAGKLVYTRQRLSSTDPTVSPVITGIVTSVRGPNIMTGALIPATAYSYQKRAGEIYDDVSGQSSLHWRIDKTKELIMRDRAYTPAAWPLYSADPLFLGSEAQPKVTRKSPLYRNRQFVTGGYDVLSFPESKLGDGTSRSWALTYPVDSVTSILLSGTPQTVGVLGVDTGMSFYYEPGVAGFSMSGTLPVPTKDQQIDLVYVARVPYTAMKENTAQQALLATLNNSTGIVEALEQLPVPLPRAAADQVAQARIDQYAILSVDWTFHTRRGGLSAGQLLSLFVPEYSLNDLDTLVTGISATVIEDGSGALLYDYSVDVTSGPNLGVWQRIFKRT